MYRQNSLNAPRFTNETNITPGCAPKKNLFVYTHSYNYLDADDEPLFSENDDETKTSNPRSPLQINNTISTNLIHQKTTNFRNELKQILNLAWPVSSSTVAQIAMFNIDTAFLGHLGTTQLAGASLASIVAELASTFLYAPAYSLNSLCTQAIGAGNRPITGNWLQLSIVIAAIMCIPTIILLFNVRNVLSIVEADESVLHYAEVFGEYSSLYILPSVLYMALLQYFQALGIVKPATIISFICIGLNVALNSILIYGVADWNGLNFKGSPIATTLATVIQCSLLFIWCILIKKYHIKANAWNGFTLKSFQKRNIKTFLNVIGPLTMVDASENWSYQIVALWCAQLRATDVASMAVLVNIWMMLWAVYWGIGLATVARAAKAAGSLDVDALKMIIKISFILSVIICGIISMLVFFLRNEIAEIFSNDHMIQHILQKALPVLALNFFVEGIGWTASAVLDGMSNGKIKSIISTSCSWILFVPLAVYFGVYSDIKKKHPDYAITIIWVCGYCMVPIGLP